MVDNVSQHLDAARKAIDTKDDKKAAAELRTVADDLKQQAARAGKADQALVQADRALVAADTKAGQDTIKRLDASALKVSSAAISVESGKIKTEADLDKAIDRAARADMEHRCGSRLAEHDARIPDGVRRSFLRTSAGPL